MVINLQVKWLLTYETKEDMEKDLKESEENWFKGPGWYLSNNDHLLIVSTNDCDNPFASNVEGPWRVYNYSSDIGTILGMVFHAPTRQDNRD